MQSDSWHFHLNFSGFFCHSFTASATVLRFLPTSFFYLALLPHILTRFCDSDTGRNTTSRILLCACPHRVVSSGWCMVLNNSYCRYQVYQSRQWATKYRVRTKLPDMFQPTYACSKTIKTLWIRLVNKYCLKVYIKVNLKKQPPDWFVVYLKKSTIIENNQCLMDKKSFWACLSRDLSIFHDGWACQKPQSYVVRIRLKIECLSQFVF